MKVRTFGLKGFALLALSTFAFAACEDKTTTVTPPTPVAVTVTPSSLSLNVGQTAPLVAIVSNSTNQSVTWTSSTPAVATVSATGVVTAVAPGTAVITATSVADPTARSAAAVVVNPAAPVVITLVPEQATINPAGTVQLVPLVTGTTNTAVTYRTSAPTVATVSATGLVTGVAQGTAVITAIASADTTKRATSVITVQPTTGGGVQIAVTPTDASVVQGGTSQFFATVTGSTNTAVTWRSLTPAIATVNAQGVATGVAVGTATIQAIAQADTTRRQNVTLRVTAAAPPPSISIQNVTPVGANNTVTGQITATVNVSADVSHDVRRVEVRIDGQSVCVQTFAQPLGTTQGVATITCPINTADTTATGAPRFPNGPHVLSAVAINGAGTVVAQATYPTLNFQNANVATATVTFTSSAIGHDGFLWNRGDATVRVRSFIFENIGTNTLSAATVNMHVGGTVVGGVCAGGTVLSQTANAGNNFTVVFAEGTAASNGPLWDITEQDVCFSIGAAQTTGGQPIMFTTGAQFNQQFRVDNEEPVADPIPADMGLPTTALNWLGGTFQFTATAPGAGTPGLLANVTDDGQSLAGFIACPSASVECSGVALPAGVRFFAVPTSTVGTQPDTDEGNAALVAGQTPVTSSSQLNNSTTNDFYTVIAEVRDRVGNVVYVRGPAFGVDRNLPSLSVNSGSPLSNSINQQLNPSGGRVTTGTPPAYTFVFADTIGGAQSDFSANPVQVRLTRHWSTRMLCYNVNTKALVAAGDMIALNDDANRTRTAVAGDTLPSGSPAGCPWITLTTPNAFSFDLTGLPEGYWQVQIRAVDRAGNTTVPSTPGSGSSSTTREHIIDVTAPTVVLPPLQAIATASDSVGLRMSDVRQRFAGLPAPTNASPGLPQFTSTWSTIPVGAATQIASIGIANRVLTRSFTLSTTLAAWRGVQLSVGGGIAPLDGVGFGVWDIARNFAEVITSTTAGSAHDGAYDALGSGAGFNQPADLATLVLDAGGATTISNGISRQVGSADWGIAIGNGVPTSRTLTVTATGTTAAFRRPFTAVHYYRVDQFGQIFYMGQAGAPSVTFPGGVAAYSYAFSASTAGVPADPAQEFFAIGVDFNGDAIMTNQVTLQLQGAYQTLN
jgi:uncharacterized protein YjdB